LPECYVERLDALKDYYYELSDMRANLVSVREGLSSPESEQLTHEPTLGRLSEDLTAAIELLESAEDKLFSLLPREEFAATWATSSREAVDGVCVGVKHTARKYNMIPRALELAK
jgi:hypothetical protein